MTGYFEQEILQLFALQLGLPCQIGIILKTLEKANLLPKTITFKLLADDLTFTFSFVSGKVILKTNG